MLVIFTHSCIAQTLKLKKGNMCNKWQKEPFMAPAAPVRFIIIHYNLIVKLEEK